MEDYQVVIAEPEDLDFGDAPDPTYPTLRESDGARHGIMPAIYLGNLIDPEPDGQPTLTALGDDNDGLDDEDGVVLTSALAPGQLATMDVTASVAGFLNAWMDGNLDGDWFDPGEHVIAGLSLSAGTNPVQFALPPEFSQGQTYARFRFSTLDVNRPTGLAVDGEVEDYRFLVSLTGNPHHFAAEFATESSLGQRLRVDGDGPIEHYGCLDRGGRRLPHDVHEIDSVWSQWDASSVRWDTRLTGQRNDFRGYARVLQPDRRPATDVAGICDILFARPDADGIFDVKLFPPELRQLTHKWH